MRNIIIEAINNQNLVELVYDGGARIVEPYCFGISKQGNELLRVYQVSGFSSTNKMDWKLLSIDKIINLKILDEKFLYVRNDYKRGDKAMSTIYCEI